MLSVCGVYKSQRAKGQSGRLTYQFILQEHLSVFVLNGYEELENFHDLNEAELDYLGITEPGQRAKIMSAVDLMQDTCKFDILLYLFSSKI